MDAMKSDKHADTADDPMTLSRRAVLFTGTIAATVMAKGSAAVADADAANFGAPLVELIVPANALSVEQKADMIKGVADVFATALKQPPDPSRRMFVEIIETAEGGFGVNGQVFVPHAK